MLCLSTIMMADRRQRLWVLPDGRRRRSLSERFDRFVADGFEQQARDFDQRAVIQTPR